MIKMLPPKYPKIKTNDLKIQDRFSFFKKCVCTHNIYFFPENKKSPFGCVVCGMGIKRSFNESLKRSLMTELMLLQLRKTILSLYSNRGDWIDLHKVYLASGVTFNEGTLYTYFVNATKEKSNHFREKYYLGDVITAPFKKYRVKQKFQFGADSLKGKLPHFPFQTFRSELKYSDLVKNISGVS